jgi:hypothetical protein
MLFILLHMDTHCSTSPSVSPPLSLAGPQFEIEVMKGVSEISLEAPKASEGACHGTILANKNQVVGDVERDDNWTLDARNPRNWPSGKKWASVSVVSPMVVVPTLFQPDRTMTIECMSLRHDRLQSIPSSPPLSAL